MKKKLTGLLIFASAGALFQTAFADDAQIKAGTQSNGQPEANVELRGNINEPAGVEVHANASAMQPSQLQRATELIGMDVRNAQDEKLGAIKDVMVNLQSGQAPFAVISSGGFFGVGDRLLAIPTASFQQNAGQDQFVINMDRERLKAAPSFDKNSWPNMSDTSWNSEIYSYYGQPAPQESSVAQTTTTQTEINEAAGAQRPSGYHSSEYRDSESSSIPGHSDWKSQSYGETPSGVSRDRTPRQGLGADDLTRNEEKLNNPGGYARSDAFISESAGAERHHGERTTTTTSEERRTMRTTPSASATLSGAKVKRATDLIGMEVKDAQNQRVGEIKDVVIDMHSGRVAYTVLDASGAVGSSDKLYAVPPAAFTPSSDQNWLVFNTDTEQLKSAPSFNKDNWPQANNQQFTTEVYRYYHQQPYWQSSRQIEEPAGAQPKMNEQKNQQDSSSEWQRGVNNPEPNQSQKEIQEPSGAAPSAPAGELNEPTPQTEPERNANPTQESPDQVNGSAAKETSELQQPRPEENNIKEPAGAAATPSESAAPAASEDQAANPEDRRMSQQLRTTLQGDSSLSGIASNVKVSASNGRITLTGSVPSEEQKNAIGMKAQELAGSADKVDNQLQVDQNSPNP